MTNKLLCESPSYKPIFWQTYIAIKYVLKFIPKAIKFVMTNFFVM